MNKREFIDALIAKAGDRNDQEFGKRFGVSKQTVGYWKSGKGQIPFDRFFVLFGQETLNWIKKEYNIADTAPDEKSEEVLKAEAQKIQLLLDRGLVKFKEPQLLAIPKEHFIEEEHGNIEVPHYQHRVAAGLPADSTSPAETLALPKMLVKHPSQTYAVTASGDSMTGAGIEAGDILIVDTAIEPQHKNIVIASLDGEQTVKRLWIEGKNIKLMPENSHHEPIEITRHMKLDIQGVVVWVIRKTA